MTKTLDENIPAKRLTSWRAKKTNFLNNKNNTREMKTTAASVEDMWLPPAFYSHMESVYVQSTIWCRNSSV